MAIGKIIKFVFLTFILFIASWGYYLLFNRQNEENRFSLLPTNQARADAPPGSAGSEGAGSEGAGSEGAGSEGAGSEGAGSAGSSGSGGSAGCEGCGCSESGCP